MKIDTFTSGLEPVKTELDEKFFSIADPAFIFDLLRNKIYSDPISAICREVACNALDAQREVGKGHIPIKIQLPTFSDLYFKVKDCGPGISPDRMENIFLKYAASSKRDDNNQIGGFGIGAKSPFSYSDSFTIVTNVDGKKYNYLAFIDESRIGKLILLDETTTTEENGTEIIVPVQSQDCYNFNSGVSFAIKHWQVKPEFLGEAKAPLQEVNKIFGGDNWFVSAERYSYYTRTIKALVGEIEYALDVNAMNQFAETSVTNLFNGDLYLKFNVGEVGLAANRESVYFDPPTKQIIKERLSLVKEEYKKFIQEKIDTCPSLYEANCFYTSDLHSVCQNVSELGELKWKGFRLRTSIRNSDAVKTIAFSIRRNIKSKITRTYCTGVDFKHGTKLVINDCGDEEPTPKHVKKFFEDDLQLRNLYIISPGKDQDIEDMIDTYNLDQMGLDYLSKYNESIKKTTTGGTKVLLFRFNGIDNFHLTNIADFKADKNKKVLAYLGRDEWRSNVKIPLKSNKKESIRWSALQAISRMDPNITIYGVDKDAPQLRVNTIFANSSLIDNYISEISNKYSREYFIEAAWAESEVRCIQQWVRDSATILEKSLSNKDGVFFKFIKEQADVIKICNDTKNAVMLRNDLDLPPVTNEEIAKFAVDNNKMGLSDTWTKILIKYQMLNIIESWRLSDRVKYIADYINLVDNSKE